MTRRRTTHQISADLKDADAAFWGLFEAVFRSDHAHLAAPRRAGIGHARSVLVEGAVWITAFRSQSSGTIGAFLRCKGPTGLGAYEDLLKHKRQVNAGLRRTVPASKPFWGESPSASEREIAIGVDAPTPWSDRDNQLHAAWLASAVNALYGAISPFFGIRPTENVQTLRRRR